MVQAAMQAAGSVFGGVSSYEAGKYNRKAQYAAATASEQDGADQEARIRENARAAIGNQINAQGASGFQQGTGSALDALQQSQVNAELDQLTVRRQAAAKAIAQRQQGNVAYAAGKNALVASLIGAGGKAASAVDWASPSMGSSAGAGGAGYPAEYGYASSDPVSVTSGYSGGFGAD